VSSLPFGWSEGPLGGVCRIVSGATPKTGDARLWGGGIPWLTPNDMSRDRSQTLVVGERSLTQAGYDSCSAKMFPAGSVVVSSRAPVGYVAIAGQDMCTNQGCKTAVRPEIIDSRYLYWYLVAAKPDLEARASGTTFKEISSKRFAETRLRWPELDKQRRIVEILEDHLSRLDAAGEYESIALRRIASLREELVRRAVTGADEPGGRHVADLADVGTLDGKLPALPSGWAWQRLGEIAEVVGGVTKDAKRQSLPGLVEVPYLRVANVQRAGLRLDQVTTIRVTPEKARALRLEPGDLLLNEGGDRDKLARGWVWQGEIDPCIHQNHVFRARLRVEVDPYFVSCTANTIGGSWAERNGKQSVNLASISLSMIRRMPVIVPPAGMSQAITERLQDQLAETARLASATEAAGRRRDGLRRAVLAGAFEGKLTGRRADAELIEELAAV
jgi:type I restriction enzyme S subunit